jgi:hypothetical protein
MLAAGTGAVACDERGPKLPFAFAPAAFLLTKSAIYAAAPNGWLTEPRFDTTSAALGSPFTARAIDSFTAR